MGSAVRDLNFASPNMGDASLHHLVEYRESLDPAALVVEVNSIIDGRELPAEQKFYINSFQWGTYSKTILGPPPITQIWHYCFVWYTIMGPPPV